MAAPTTVYITPQQRKRLFARAKKRKTSFSDELRSAVDLYLDLPPDLNEELLTALVKDANASLDRSIARLDRAVASLRSASQCLAESEKRLDGLDKGHIRRG